MPLDFINPHLEKLLAGVEVEGKEISSRLELILVDHPVKPFRFKDCTFNVSPTLPADPSHGHPALIFDHCTFRNPLKLNSLRFHRELILRSCRFERYVDFTDTRFFHGVSFKDCSFDEKAYFERATFGVDLNAITFALDSPPWKRKCFEGMAIDQLANQSGANFGEAVFNDGAEFDQVVFHVRACFYKTTWYEATTFLRCQFPFGKDSKTDIINFSYAQIAGSVEFNQSLRLSKERPDTQPYDDGEVSEECIHANFQYIHVHKPHGLRFHTENLSCCSVLGTNLDACHFSNVRWPKVETHYPLALRKSSAFLRIVLQNYSRQRTWAVVSVVKHFIVYVCSFAADWIHFGVSWILRLATRWMVPHRSDDQGSNRSQTFAEYRKSCKTLKQYCIWDHRIQNQEEQDKALKGFRNYRSVAKLEEKIPRWRDQWALLSRAYRDLKTAYEENKDYIYASDFHYAEKEFRRINYEVPRQIRIQLQLYWLVSGYGERVLRPIWWFLLIWILGAIPYACSDQVKVDEQASIRATQSR